MHLTRPNTGGHFAWLALAALSLAACDNTPSEPTTPSAITVTTGTAIPGRAGSTANVTVAVTTSNGKTLPNTPVTFGVSSGGGSVVPPSTSTDANGRATATWTFGTTLGAQTLTVTAGTVTQTITATVTAGLPASVAVSAGANQSAPVGTAVTTAPAVVVRDASGNPVQGVAVQFTSLPTGAVAPSQVSTDASGVARVTSWILGQAAGTYTLQATVLDANIRTGNPVMITATATAGAATRVQPSGSFPSTAVVGTALTGTSLPAVLVSDANGNPVSGASVTFAVTSGGGQITGGTVTTNAQGIATAGGFTLGQTAGANTITATVQGVGTVNLAVTGTAGPAATTQIVSGNNQSTQAGSTLVSGPSVRVVDRFGNPVAGATVQFLVTSGNGSVLGSTQTTNAQGIATVGGWTLGVTPGTNTLVARVAGAADVTFTATGLAGAPAQLRKASADSLNVVAFQPSAPFVVQVVDAAGFPVQNATVTFALQSTTMGTLSAATAQTDSLGRASTVLTTNGVLGQNTLTATVGALAPVQFTVTTVQNTPATAAAVGGTSLAGTAGYPITPGPAVIVRDAAGNPVPGITVFFDTYGTTSGAVQNRVAVTDATGIASAGNWTLSGTPGTNTLAASVSAVGIPAIIFTATGLTVPIGTTVAQVAGITPTTAPAGSVVAAAALVKDAAGNPLPGLTVQIQVTAGGGNLAGKTLITTVTDASGIVRVPAWTLGSGSATVNSLLVQVITGPTTVINVTTQ